MCTPARADNYWPSGLGASLSWRYEMWLAYQVSSACLQVGRVDRLPASI